jgi:RNA polymerase sigma factor (TIGR02999 family)
MHDRPEPAPRDAGELLPLVYAQLHAAARAHLASERQGHTLQPTALIHEAFLKLAENRQVPWQNQEHFYAAAAAAMRQVLIDHARTRGRLKRGGGRARTDLASVADLADADLGEILRFDEVFGRLERESPEYAAVVRLRFYAGLSIEQTATTLGISTSTVDRRWSLARAWLFRELA